MTQDPPALSVRGLSVQFGDIVALKAVTFAVGKGGSLGVIGPNGAGKTTLFHALTGDINGCAGEVWIDTIAVLGKGPSEVSRMGLGKLFQDVRVFPHLTVRENLLVALQDDSARAWHHAWFRRPTRQDRLSHNERVDRILERLELARDVDTPAGRLSFGDQKTLALGRLLAGRFSILLLDEPMAGLSPARAAIVGNVIEELVHVGGTTVLLIEHNMQHVKRLCRETLVLNHGNVVTVGPTADVIHDANVQEICLGL